ncbi:MAG: hypothetical protein COB04_03025 [Gammaproteobacteria bacterium]|nr:MAG: hypothetical protein COB04_03025 [Gammaproteobacteria bacterium]
MSSYSLAPVGKRNKCSFEWGLAGCVWVGMISCSGYVYCQNLTIQPTIEVVEDNTWVKEDQVEKVKLYNNGITETIIINKETGHISIDMRPTQKRKAKPKKKSKPSKKTKMDKKEIGTANIALQLPMGEDDALSPLEPNTNGIQFVESSDDLMLEMIEALRSNNALMNTSDENVGFESSGVESSGVENTPMLDEVEALVVQESLRGRAHPHGPTQGSVSSVSASLNAGPFHLAESKLIRKIEKRKRLARRKIQLKQKTSAQRGSAKEQRNIAGQRARRYNNIAYTCRSEGQRIKMQLNFLTGAKQQACEMLYFKSNSLKPLNIGEFQSSQCNVQAKRWLKQQKAWGWQCDSV